MYFLYSTQPSTVAHFTAGSRTRLFCWRSQLKEMAARISSTLAFQTRRPFSLARKRCLLKVIPGRRSRHPRHVLFDQIKWKPALPTILSLRFDAQTTSRNHPHNDMAENAVKVKSARGTCICAIRYNSLFIMTFRWAPGRFKRERICSKLNTKMHNLLCM